MPAQASTSTAPQPASANTWLQQGPPGPPPGPPPAGKGGLGAQAATGAPGYGAQAAGASGGYAGQAATAPGLGPLAGGAPGYGQAGGSYAPGLLVFLFHNSEPEGYFRLSPWAMQHVEPQGYRQCWAPGLLWFLSLQAILFLCLWQERRLPREVANQWANGLPWSMDGKTRQSPSLQLLFGKIHALIFQFITGSILFFVFLWRIK